MNVAVPACLLYSLVLLYSGWLGYARTGSLASVIAGVVVAALVAVFGLLARNSVPFGFAGAAVIFVMAVYFAYRLIESNRFVPSGVLMIVSFFFLFFTLLGVFLKLMRKPA